MANPLANSVKLLKAVDLLASPKGATIKELERELGISRRSVFRLFDALEELDFPLTDEQSAPRAEKIYRLEEGYMLKLPNRLVPDLRFSEPEIEALLSMLDFCIGMQESEVGVLLKGIRRKVKAISGKNV